MVLLWYIKNNYNNTSTITKIKKIENDYRTTEKINLEIIDKDYSMTTDNGARASLCFAYMPTFSISIIDLTSC